MKNYTIIFITLFFLCSGVGLAGAAPSSQPGPLLPESLASRTEMAASQKTVTIFIREKDPEKATAKVNTSNDDYAKKGWSVFSIISYNDNEDFQGFFITYQKSLIIE